MLRRRDGWRPVMDVEDAVAWAIVRQRAAAPGSRRFHPQLLAALLTVAGERGLAGELLPGAAVHPDAVAIRLAIARLADDDQARAVVTHAWAGERPDWTGGGGHGFAPVFVRGRGFLGSEPLVVRGAWTDGSRGAVEQRGDGVRAVRAWRDARGRWIEVNDGDVGPVEAAWCPIRDLAEAHEDGRAAWRIWHAGLVALAAELARGELAMAVSGPVAPAAPWEAADEAVARAPDDGRLVLAGEARTAFATAAREGARPKALAARFGITARQAKDLSAYVRRRA